MELINNPLASTDFMDAIRQQVSNPDKPFVVVAAFAIIHQTSGKVLENSQCIISTPPRNLKDARMVRSYIEEFLMNC